MKKARRLHNLGIEGEKASNTMGLAVMEGRHLENSVDDLDDDSEKNIITDKIRQLTILH